MIFLPKLAVVYQGSEIVLVNALIDSGSAATAIDTDELLALGIFDTDTEFPLVTMRGIGGTETLFTVNVTLHIGTKTIPNFPVQVGNVKNYGLAALIGLDLLRASRVTIDFDSLVLSLV